MSQRFTLNQADITNWGKKVALFFAPTVLVFLVSLYSNPTHTDWQYALGASYTSLLLAGIDITKKFIYNG